MKQNYRGGGAGSIAGAAGAPGVPAVLAEARQTIFLIRHKHFALSGKSVLIFGNRVKPLSQKYSAFNFRKSEL
jgi:hypothetical protein